MEKSFLSNMEIRSYSKQELAMLYFPKSAPSVSLKRLNRWINRNPQLVAELNTSNTGKNAKYWSRHQVERIIYYLNEP